MLHKNSAYSAHRRKHLIFITNDLHPSIQLLLAITLKYSVRRDAYRSRDGKTFQRDFPIS